MESCSRSTLDLQPPYPFEPATALPPPVYQHCQPGEPANWVTSSGVAVVVTKGRLCNYQSARVRVPPPRAAHQPPVLF